MSMKERLHTGQLYLPGDASIMTQQLKYLDRLRKFNRIPPSHLARRKAMMRRMFAEVGRDCYIESPFYSNFGGGHVHLGDNVYFNFGVTMVDDTHIYIGSQTMLGPHVVVATAGHPILPQLRQYGYQYNAPVHIGNNCWLGAGVLVMPGVTIGDNCVIGAGSVVNKDIPANSVAVGSPCKVLRPIGEHDRQYYFKDRSIDWADISQQLEQAHLPPVDL